MIYQFVQDETKMSKNSKSEPILGGTGILHLHQKV